MPLREALEGDAPCTYRGLEVLQLARQLQGRQRGGAWLAGGQVARGGGGRQVPTRQLGPRGGRDGRHGGGQLPALGRSSSKERQVAGGASIRTCEQQYCGAMQPLCTIVRVGRTPTG